MITGVNHITLAVQNIERSFIFYRDILGLQALVKWERGAYFLVGKQDNNLPGSGFWFCLNFDPLRQVQPCYTHYAFSVNEDDFQKMEAKIIASGATVFKENTSPGKSLYFLDPDGHKLEIHLGTFRDRIVAKKETPGDWKNVEWFV